MPVPSACTGSLLVCAKAVAGVKLTPVPPSLNGRLFAWLNCSGALSVRPVPVAPAVPTAATVTDSIPWPALAMSSRILSPTPMLVVDETLMLVAPAAAAAARRACTPARPTAVTVATSRSAPEPICSFWPAVKPVVLATGTVVEPAGTVMTGPSGSGCHSVVAPDAAVPTVAILRRLAVHVDRVACGHAGRAADAHRGVTRARRRRQAGVGQAQQVEPVAAERDPGRDLDRREDRLLGRVLGQRPAREVDRARARVIELDERVGRVAAAADAELVELDRGGVAHALGHRGAAARPRRRGDAGRR